MALGLLLFFSVFTDIFFVFPSVFAQQELDKDKLKSFPGKAGHRST
jgi:hypothetical protein